MQAGQDVGHSCLIPGLERLTCRLALFEQVFVVGTQFVEQAEQQFGAGHHRSQFGTDLLGKEGVFWLKDSIERGDGFMQSVHVDEEHAQFLIRAQVDGRWLALVIAVDVVETVGRTFGVARHDTTASATE